MLEVLNRTGVPRVLPAALAPATASQAESVLGVDRFEASRPSMAASPSKVLGGGGGAFQPLRALWSWLSSLLARLRAAIPAATQPSGSPAVPAGLGSSPSSNGDAIDLRSVHFDNAPGLPVVDLSQWPVTSTITRAAMDGERGTMTIEHSRAGQWPQLPFFDDPSATVEGNVWLFANIGGQWYGGAAEWLRPGQTTKQFPVRDVGPDEFYNYSDSSPLKSWRPRSGEWVGVAVSTPARAGQWGTAERSNVVMIQWP